MHTYSHNIMSAGDLNSVQLMFYCATTSTYMDSKSASFICTPTLSYITYS